jgi:SPP1 family predicted phage head-tail adaptor
MGIPVREAEDHSVIRKGDHMTQVGRMRFEVILQTHFKVADGMGGFNVSWDNTATVRCDIQPLSMIERTQASRLMTDSTHRLIMRYREISPTTQRFQYGSRLFNITSVVNPDNMDDHLVVIVREG